MCIRDSSTGEQKLSIISIILSNAKLIKEQHKVSPIMLLDEITAHLDEVRKENLFSELLSLESQFFISGTEVGIFSSLRKKQNFWNWTKGKNLSPSFSQKKDNL